MLAMKNRYFAAVPEKVRAKWLTSMVLREYQKGETIDLTSNDGMVHFPIDAVAAMSVIDRSEATMFIRFGGSNMAVGLAQALEQGDLRYENHWCRAGYAFSIPRRLIFSQLSAASLAAGRALFAHVTAEKAVIRARCAEKHSYAQRLARILLEAADVFGEDGTLTLTHQELADFLVTRRETISGLLAEWDAAGIVDSGRGKLRIGDLGLLSGISCSCHRDARDAEQRTYDRWCRITWEI